GPRGRTARAARRVGAAVPTRRWVPWMYVIPALALLAFFLVYPSAETLRLSLLDRQGKAFVGINNYSQVFSDPVMSAAFRNNALWVGVFTFCTVSMGLTLAVLLDRVRYESLIKTIIFVPMAISMVGASVIWKFVYAFRPASVAQIGLLNAVVVALGGQPVGWLTVRPWINNLCLIVVGVWIWTGFCMVVLSAAYKGLSREWLEAARIDGAGEWQLFWRIILPLLTPTLAVVTTTMIVFVLKIFDIVYVMTNGNFSTEVLANRMIKEQFSFTNYGRAAALAVVLFLLVAPVMVVNIRRFKRRESAR
ncbi:MAG: sugar ABC transporter permease, partial [Candidatus Bipolaricaulota bacterium]